MKIKTLLVLLMSLSYLYGSAQVSDRRMKLHLKMVEKSREKGTIIRDLDTVFIAGIPYCIVVEMPNGALRPSDYSVRSLQGDELIYVKFGSYQKLNPAPVYNQYTPATTMVAYYTYYFTDTKNKAEVRAPSNVYKTVAEAGLIQGNYINSAEEDKFVSLNGMRFSQDEANSNAPPQVIIVNTNTNTNTNSGYPNNNAQNEQVYSSVQVEPKFVGDMNMFFRTHLVYPGDARMNKIEGTVYVSFIVEPNGAVSNVQVLQRVYGHQSLENEAIRVVSLMPNWLPGTQDGHPVRVRFTVPVRFTLN